MPVIQIPVAGQGMVAVDVNGFAEESTLQQIRELSEVTANALSKIAGEDAGDDSLSRNTNQILSQILNQLQNSSQKDDANAKKTQGMLGGFKGAAAGALGGAVNFGRRLEGMNAAEIVRSLGEVLGPLSAITNGLSVLIGVIEKQAASFNTLRRVGAGFGEEMDGIRSSAAMAGLQLDNFAALVLENGRAVKSLGRDTTEGAARLSILSDAFYEALTPFGGFGMNMTEINQLLLDEIEARRLTTGSIRNQNMTFKQLSNSIIENVRQQEAMSRLTGQDMRERMAAQQAGRQDARVRATLIGASETLKRNFDNVNATLSRFDPTGQITSAFGQAFATGYDPMAFAPELMSVLGPEIQGILRSARNNMESMNPEQFQRTFEAQMQVAFENVRNNEQQMQQLIYLSQSTQGEMANAANSFLQTLTSFQRIQEQRQMEDAAIQSDTGVGAVLRMERAIIEAMNETQNASFNNASLMQSSIDRFSAAISMQMTNFAMGAIEAGDNTIGALIRRMTGSEPSPNGNNAVTSIMNELRNLLMNSMSVNQEVAQAARIQLQQMEPVISQNQMLQNIMGSTSDQEMVRQQQITNEHLSILVALNSNNQETQVQIINQLLQQRGFTPSASVQDMGSMSPTDYYFSIINSQNS